MKRIAVITLDGLKNYGNRLQNYAVRFIYEKFGCTCVTLACKDYMIKEAVKFMLAVLTDVSRFGCRTIKFLMFNHRFIPTEIVYSRDHNFPSSLSDEYDFFSVGSDQVWNPHTRGKDRDNYFLRFVPREKRIALAASISSSEIPDRFRENFRNGINGFDFVSVRENDAADLIFDLCGRRPEVLIDPTLVLTQDEWIGILSRHDSVLRMGILDKNYVLVYFLGELSAQSEADIRRYANANGYEIAVLYIKNRRTRFYSCDPADFVRLVMGAKYVFTDSFHGVAFSVNFNIPFYVFHRYDPSVGLPSMESRICSLLSILGLEDRLVDEFSDCADSIDFSEANIILSEKRVEFYDFVNRAINRRGLQLNGET